MALLMNRLRPILAVIAGLGIASTTSLTQEPATAPTSAPNAESKPSTPPSTSLSATADAPPLVAPGTPDPAEKLKTKPKQVTYGGGLVHLFQSTPKAPLTADSDPDAPKRTLTGWQLFNLKAPVDRSVETSDWTGKRPRSKRMQKPKTTDTEGIKLFTIRF